MLAPRQIRSLIALGLRHACGRAPIASAVVEEVVVSAGPAPSIEAVITATVQRGARWEGEAVVDIREAQFRARMQTMCAGFIALDARLRQGAGANALTK